MLKYFERRCLFLFLACLQMGGLFADCPDQSEEPPQFQTFVSATELGGIGYDQGYTSLEFFITPRTSTSFYPFIDAEVHCFNNGRMAANGGIGLRGLVSDHWILGGNAYYDYRNIHNDNLQQVGLGLELLGCHWDFRTNVYIPVSERKKRTRKASFDDFSGNFFAERKQFHYNFYGADFEVGTSAVNRWFGLDDCPIFYIALGPYWYQNGHFHNTVGVRFRLAAQITQCISLEGRVTSDHLFKTHVQGIVRIEIPFENFKKLFGRIVDCCCDMCEKLTSLPFRNEIIPTKKDCSWECNYNCPQ